MNQPHTEAVESPSQGTTTPYASSSFGTFTANSQGNVSRGLEIPPSSAHTHAFCGSPPPELIDAVIDQLRGDVDALKACALTSSSWLPASRYHLFDDVFLEDAASILRWAQTFSTSSDIPSYVENLHVGCVSLLDDSSNLALDLSTFTHLTGLFIGGNKVTPRYRHLSENPFRRIILLPSTCLRTFSLSFPVLPISDVFLVVRHFHCLDNLSLRCFAVLPSTDAVDTKTDASPSFRGALTLVSHLNYRPLVTNLLAFSGGIHFAHLNITVLRDDELPNLRDLVDACSHTITSLHITLDLGKWDLPPTYLSVPLIRSAQPGASSLTRERIFAPFRSFQTPQPFRTPCHPPRDAISRRTIQQHALKYRRCGNASA